MNDTILKDWVRWTVLIGSIDGGGYTFVHQLVDIRFDILYIELYVCVRVHAWMWFIMLSSVGRSRINGHELLNKTPNVLQIACQLQ